MDYLKEYERWLSKTDLDERLKAELISIHGDDDEIRSRFSECLHFGTGGLRGFMAAGTNRMNIYTVAQASLGFGNYICSLGESAKKRGVVIAHDCRNNGVKFAKTAALTMCRLGINVYVFDGLRPTPELSFAIRELGTIAGINITASHNPKEYNGYKAYFEDGAQIAGEQADFVMAEMQKVDPLNIKIMDEKEAINAGLYHIVGSKLDEKYIQKVLEQKLELDNLSPEAKDVSIVYSPFYGAGYKLVPHVLSMIGANVTVVKEQSMPDGDFPTLKSPNPEEKEGMKLAIELAQKINAELIIATDPDADRVAMAALLPGGQVEMFTGNQTGVLLADFIITVLKDQGKLPQNSAIISTIVSTRMIKQVCEQNNIKYFEVLTGFKYIGEKIKEFEKDNSYSYLFGFEESYGYLKGTHARDKDSVVSSMLIAQMAMYYKNKGKNLKQALDDLYKKYGYFDEKTVNFKIEAAIPMEQTAKIMNSLRQDESDNVCGQPLEEFRDYKQKIVKNFVTGEKHETDLPVSDVLYYVFKDGTSVAVRPSGTEPKVKLYVMARGENKFDCSEKINKYLDIFEGLIK